ncbi:hypothetical protein J40TS1_03160 [Paenibacillus montaniterrae]|uniref:Copper amine oxidase-like N-terminal domain-containing protein n=1 Tax=Paenibacillus montaniterrae TaxID=429341 RepID=A0A919YM40_9BACL|nr:stalk domain-containing protein [Paenibacillus montaniterrae]GIP14674.1 hypothetical protein J40TS1_03160 [Paenibacillus montaniterrae]
MKQWMKIFAVSAGGIITALILLLPLQPQAKAEAAAPITDELVYHLTEAEAYRNGERIDLDPPAAVIDDNVYLPVKFLGNFFELSVSYDAASKTARLADQQRSFQFDPGKGLVTVNGSQLESQHIAIVQNDRIMVQLAWLSEQLGADYLYVPQESKIVVRYEHSSLAQKPANAKPVAKFAVDKQAYAIGETITYTNLSYDPDADAVSLSWTGREDAFFTAGEHEVTLVAIDQNGNRSEPYTKKITVTEQFMFSAFEYGVYSGKPGSYIEANDQRFNDQLLTLPEASKKVRSVEARKLLVSDSPENIKEAGILYQDHIEGKARLYANHVNEMDRGVTLAILATNDTEHPVTLKTTRQGASQPSQFAMIVGSEAAIDFLSDESSDVESDRASGNSGDELLTIAPGETAVYRHFPALAPKYGVNAIYDVEASGELLISFVAIEDRMDEDEKSSSDRSVMGQMGADPAGQTEAETETVNQADHAYLHDNAPLDAIATGPVSELLDLPKLSYNGHVRGSFNRSEIVWDVYPSKQGRKRVQRLMIADGSSDPFIQGFDPQRDSVAPLYGNYGAVYNITIHKPGRMAILLMARGGSFKGAFKVNEQFVRVPSSGMLNAFEGFVTLATTKPDDKQLTLQFMPPAGSSLPIMLVLYPLDKRAAWLD